MKCHRLVSWMAAAAFSFVALFFAVSAVAAQGGLDAPSNEWSADSSRSRRGGLSSTPTTSTPRPIQRANKNPFPGWAVGLTALAIVVVITLVLMACLVFCCGLQCPCCHADKDDAGSVAEGSPYVADRLADSRSWGSLATGQRSGRALRSFETSDGDQTATISFKYHRTASTPVLLGSHTTDASSSAIGPRTTSFMSNRQLSLSLSGAVRITRPRVLNGKDVEDAVV